VEKRIGMRKSESRMEKCGVRNRRIRIDINRRACTRTRGQVAKEVFCASCKDRLPSIGSATSPSVGERWGTAQKQVFLSG